MAWLLKHHPATPTRTSSTFLAVTGCFALVACSSGYTPARVPEPDINALLESPSYATIQITHEVDATRSVITTAFGGTIIMEYMVDDKLVGHHSVHSNFDEIVHVGRGDHELVVQQCYRGLFTLGGRSCEYIKYHFRIAAGERARVRVIQPNVLRPKASGFLQWHELDASRY